MKSRSILPFLVTSLITASLSAQQGSAVFEATFTATWSKTTHPVSFPSNPHFSPLIGGTHKSTTSFWAPGGIATSGIEVMAETGGTSALRSEIQSAISSGGAKSVVAGSGLGRSPGSVTVRFTAAASHPRFTIVTMMAPSPDWFVGLSGFPLMDKGRWIKQATVAATVWDAGSDNGSTYTSANSNTSPKKKIAVVTAASGPFKGYSTTVGTWTIKRIAGTRVYGCGVNPAGSMAVSSGVPLLGQTVMLQLHDPGNSMGKGSNTHLFLGAAPVSGFPCGVKIPGFGMKSPGADGELLIDLIVARIDGAAWQGSPVTFPLAVPNNSSLIGLAAYAQGALRNGSRLGVTDAVEIHLGK
jgi:Spondin_N